MARTTRRAILSALKELEQATVKDLDEAVPVKEVTIRHHLNALQADGLVTVEPCRQPVGRPYYVYRLTPTGEALLDQTRHILIEGLTDFVRLPFSERLKQLLMLLDQAGYTPRHRQGGDGVEVVAYECPYEHGTIQHTGLCALEEDMLQTVLNAEVRREACLRDGDTVCTLALVNQD